MTTQCYYFYGTKGTGKTLTAKLLSQWYDPINGNPYQPFVRWKNTFSFRGYKGEKVILIDNDMYKGREFQIYLMITNWRQVSPVKRSGYIRYCSTHERFEEYWEPPKYVIVCSREIPTGEMKKWLTETKSKIYQYKYINNQNILEDIQEKFPELKEIISKNQEEENRGSETESDSEVPQEEKEEKKPKKRIRKKKEILKGNILDYLKLNGESKS